jgi:hypothetical protein
MKVSMLMKKEQTFYDQMSVAEKRRLRELMTKQKTLLVEQRQVILDSLIKAMTQRINLTEEFLHSKIPLEHYIQKQKELGEYIKKFFG